MTCLSSPISTIIHQPLNNPTPKPPSSSLQNFNSLILTNTKHGNFSQAFNLLSNSPHKPNEFTLSTLLRASSTLSDPLLGRQLHAKSIRAGLASDPGVRTALVSMYSASGHLNSSRKVFDEMPSFDVPLWNSIVSAYIVHRQHAESFALLSTMIDEHLSLTVATYVIVIRACAEIKRIEIGRMLHARMTKDMMVNDVKLLNTLITLYSKCGELRDARKVFDMADGMNVVSWNAMIAGYGQNGECEQALSLFSMLARKRELVKPNRITFLSALSAISSVLDLRLGKQVHAQVIRTGLECETSIGNSLITMYGKCGNVAKGRLVFDKLPVRDVITWNSMLAAYAQDEQSEKCYELFRKLQLMGIEPDDHTITILLSANSSELSSCKLGREIHGYLLRRSVSNLMQKSVCNAIITMYAKKDRLADAEKIFKGMGEKDPLSWNAMMDGYSMNGRYDEVIKLFVDLLGQGLKFDHLTLSILLTACGRLVSIELAKQFHGFTLKHQLHLCKSKTSLLSINNALVSMYSKCGNISDAARVFQRMKHRDVFSWTAMITGYAHQGMAYESLHLFEKMRTNGIKPNSITFLGLLTACAHAGLIKEGVHYFNLMSKDNNIEASIEHYACMVDLFGRSGQFERAEAMVAKHGSSISLWRVLLGACHAHKQLELGKKAATRILELEPEDETTHILLSNLYAYFGMWREAVDVRMKMSDKGLKKEVGCSWLEIASRRHIFVAGDVSHPNREEIYEKLGELGGRCREIGYVPMTELVLYDVDEVQKEAILSWHSEKLAVSFAMVKAGNGRGVVRVIKNLRVCGDCHNWMKLVSKVEGREIVLRDSTRFHSFKDGKCSCGDFW